MEPLFQLNVDNLDIVLMNVKRRLMMHDEDVQVTCIERVCNLFKNGGAVSSEAVLSKLIKFDVLSTIFEILHTPSDRLLPNILDFLSLVNVHRKFYECHVAMDAVDSMLKVAICVSKSRCKENQLLEKLVSVISDVLNRAVEFNVDFDAVCVPRQVLCLLKSLILDNSPDPKLKFSSIALLCVVLEHMGIEEEREDVAFKLCHKALDLMKEIVKYSDDEASVSLALVALCDVSASGVRLCIPKSDGAEMFDKSHQRKATLTKSIHGTTMYTLIPHLRNAESNETDRVKFHRSLVICLNSLYKLPDCNHDDLSNHLTGNGCLKRFLLLTTRLPENLRRSTCVLLSRVITTLADKSMSIGQWLDGSAAFESLMHRGLLDLPRDPQRWSDVLAHRGNSSLALMMLIYYHFHGTRENDMICLRSLIVRIIDLPTSEQIPSQTLKVVWFLFAVGSVHHPLPNSERDYNKAVKRLAALLRYSRSNECYTHHIDLLRYCLKCPEVPAELRNKTMDLWLVESDGDIKPLLTLDCDRVVKHYLLLVIQTGYSQRIIRLAMKGIREMIRGDNAREIAEIAWHMLPDLLSSYAPDKDEQIKAVLELTNIFIPDSLSLGTRNRCADRLTAVVLRRDADLGLRTLAVMHSYALLVTSATSKPFTIFETYIGTPNFLEELLVQGFAVEIPEFSAVCLKLLAFVVHCHEKSSIQRDKPLTIDVQSLADSLFSMRKSVHASINGMQLALELFTRSNDGSPVRLDGVTSNGGRGVVNLYETIRMLHAKSDPIQRDIVYQCLQGVLRFCHKHAEPLMYHMCTLMSNYDLVISTLDSRYVSYHFLDFVSTWFRYRRRYCNDEGPWNPKSIRKTPFEEILDRVRMYVNTVKDARVDAAVNSLRYAVLIWTRPLSRRAAKRLQRGNPVGNYSSEAFSKLARAAAAMLSRGPHKPNRDGCSRSRFDIAAAAVPPLGPAVSISAFDQSPSAILPTALQRS
ncbi:hypothetical protein WN55_05557 [Dufourea novaeangliae]|uniref:Uncharacterized protein n=1 Tax=Dufourea novaeangliae TaxID=178035 RepID=A0A154PMZ3_DUFNO|nr:hypothetical protein WN55_05557 [Dufourea novaeangliae]